MTPASNKRGKATKNDVFVTVCILKGVFGLVGLGDVR